MALHYGPHPEGSNHENLWTVTSGSYTRERRKNYSYPYLLRPTFFLATGMSLASSPPQRQRHYLARERQQKEQREEEGLRSATSRRRIGWLRCTAGLAGAEGMCGAAVRVSDQFSASPTPVLSLLSLLHLKLQEKHWFGVDSLVPAFCEGNEPFP